MKYWNAHGCATLLVWGVILAAAGWWAGRVYHLW
jgi:hypothetical protein